MSLPGNPLSMLWAHLLSERMCADDPRMSEAHRVDRLTRYPIRFGTVTARLTHARRDSRVRLAGRAKVRRWFVLVVLVVASVLPVNLMAQEGAALAVTKIGREPRDPARPAVTSLGVDDAGEGSAEKNVVQVQAPVVRPPAPAERPALPPVAAGQDGFAIQSADGDFRLQIGLLVHADGRFAAEDADQQVVDTFAFRRLRPYLRARFSRRFEFYFNPDFAGGTLVVQDAYVDTVFSPALRIRAGKGKTPFGLERLHSASNLLFFNRALPTALVPNRDLGIQVLGDISGGVISYLAGVMNGVPDGGSADVDTSDGKDLSGRLVVRPFNTLADSPLRGFGLAISGSNGRQAGASALPAFRTQSLEQPYFAYSGASADGVRTRYSPQAFYSYKAFGGFAEYVHTNTPIRKGVVREEIAHDAWQVAGSYVLTGEAATDAGAGVRPRANVDFGNGHFGALQIAARYHTLRVDERALTLGFASVGSSRKADAWTLGLNWYLTGNFRYTLNFERTVFDDGPEGPRKAENAVVFRTQVSF
jgi:phosphate-selective porin OprO/OprP